MISFFFLQVVKSFMGKKVTARCSDSFGWCTIGDSHNSKLLNFYNTHGISAVAISGGWVRHGRKFLRSSLVNIGKVTCYFMFLNGNDLSSRKSLKSICADVSRMIKQIRATNPDALVVTGTPVPRGENDAFISRSECLDARITQYIPNHHHFITDLFVGDPDVVTGKVTPRLELYINDKTHLGYNGLSAYKELLSYVIESVNNASFTGGRWIDSFGVSRSVFWKF